MFDRMDCLQDAPSKAAWLKPFHFTVENAKINARKAVAVRVAKAKAELGNALNPSCVPEAFRDRSAARTREQMQLIQTKIDDLLAGPKLDSKVLKELTEALARLETIEQKLSGRASPGSLRPRDNTKGRRSDRQQAAPEPEVEEVDTTRPQDPSEPNG